MITRRSPGPTFAAQPPERANFVIWLGFVCDSVDISTAKPTTCYERRMPKLNIEQAHRLPLDEVKKRLQALADRLSAKYGIDAAWTSPTEASVKRTGVSGKITCSDSKVTVFLDLAFVLSPLKDRVENRVRQELQTCLA
jgi:putative polyhydroxyalkanoate system protein